MERIDNIIKHTLFVENLNQNMAWEAERRFCRHDLAHFLDVARIARIINLEERLEIEEELLYAAALLHDLGRHLQYSDGISHEKAGAELASKILPDCGFDRKETEAVVEAIISHRGQEAEARNRAGVKGQNLAKVLYRADKAGRPCFLCPARQDCHWGEEQKNLVLRY